MNYRFDDILSRIPEPPTWYDSNGTPRYGAFTPDACPNIYSREVGLFRIACQQCGREFFVEMHGDIFGNRRSNIPAKWHYGDPPRHFDCLAGDTMNCVDLEVVEFWTREHREWQRRPELEGRMDCPWNLEADE